MEWFTEKYDATMASEAFVTIGQSVLVAVGITLLIITPLLYWCMYRVRSHMADMENWDVERVVMTEGYEYQVHRRTGQRRVTTRLIPKPPIDKDWLAGRTENLK